MQRTMSTTALNTNDFALEVDAVDPCRIADDDAWPRASSLTAEPGASTPQAVKDWLRDGSVEDSYLDIGRDREGTGGLGKGVAGGNHESGEVVRALNRLRQMLADLEELAKEEELNDEVQYEGGFLVNVTCYGPCSICRQKVRMAYGFSPYKDLKRPR